MAKLLRNEEQCALTLAAFALAAHHDTAKRL
jgi:hypothetical protein